ncbi:hypothetical protein, partial [Glutamicibacter ardleyensis]
MDRAWRSRELRNGCSIIVTVVGQLFRGDIFGLLGNLTQKLFLGGGVPMFFVKALEGFSSKFFG